MKTKEELNALKKEYEELNCKLRTLTEEEMEQVTGGAPGDIIFPIEDGDPTSPNVQCKCMKCGKTWPIQATRPVCDDCGSEDWRVVPK